MLHKNFSRQHFFYFFYYFFPSKQALTFHANFLGDNLHEMLISVFWDKYVHIVYLSFAESTPRALWVKSCQNKLHNSIVSYISSNNSYYIINKTRINKKNIFIPSDNLIIYVHTGCLFEYLTIYPALLLYICRYVYNTYTHISVVSFWQKNVHNTGKPLGGLSLPSKRVVR